MHLSDPLTLLQPSSAPTLPSIVFLVTLEVLLAACVACAEYWPTRSCFIVFITLSVSQVLALPAGDLVLVKSEGIQRNNFHW
ncbi:hypothetical protein L208DRAFT_1399028 [Tricholoma matsutake]|nr:hypothetical protein L208DRAFT_1399028 [Tricholoma matsutake 945]